MDHALDKILAKARSQPKAGELVRDALLARWLKLVRALDVNATSPPDLHALRIRAKKCHYLLHSYPRSHRQSTSAWLKGLQECLGRLHDIAQARRWLNSKRTDRALGKRLRSQLRSQAGDLRTELQGLRRTRPSFIL
jgi:CHAD domain-containing protein